MKTNIIIFEEMEYEYLKQVESIEFICVRCKSRKISKKYAEHKNTMPVKRLCNGCYGKLCSLYK